MNLMNKYINNHNFVVKEIENYKHKLEIIKCCILKELKEEDILRILKKDFIKFMYYYTAIKENKSCIAYEDFEDDYYIIQKSDIMKYFKFDFLEDFVELSYTDSMRNNVDFVLTINDNNNRISIPLVKTIPDTNEEYWQDAYNLNKKFVFVANRFFDIYKKNKDEIIKHLKKDYDYITKKLCF